MTFGIYGPGGFSPLDASIENKAKRLRRRLRLHGYWQSVISVCWQNPEIRKELFKAIQRASQHEQPSGTLKTFHVGRSQITEQRLVNWIAELKPRDSLFVSSRASLADGRCVHFPMMDFACYDTPQDLRKAVFALSALRLAPGVLLRSGNSFHFYGFSTLSPVQWVQFLGTCLLLVPICDARYIGHRLIDGACTLRISFGPERRNEPTVASIVR